MYIQHVVLIKIHKLSFTFIYNDLWLFINCNLWIICWKIRKVKCMHETDNCPTIWNFFHTTYFRCNDSLKDLDIIELKSNVENSHSQRLPITDSFSCIPFLNNNTDLLFTILDALYFYCSVLIYSIIYNLLLV